MCLFYMRHQRQYSVWERFWHEWTCLFYMCHQRQHSVWERFWHEWTCLFYMRHQRQHSVWEHFWHEGTCLFYVDMCHAGKATTTLCLRLLWHVYLTYLFVGQYMYWERINCSLCCSAFWHELCMGACMYSRLMLSNRRQAWVFSEMSVCLFLKFEQGQKWPNRNHAFHLEEAAPWFS
jgi:hypothetical protein